MSLDRVVVGFDTRHTNLDQQAALRFYQFVWLVRNLMSAHILHNKALGLYD